MPLSDHSLRQIDEAYLERLGDEALRSLSSKLLLDLKEARERLNQTSRNSSLPPSREAPWDKARASGAETERGEDPEGTVAEDAPAVCAGCATGLAGRAGQAYTGYYEVDWVREGSGQTVRVTQHRFEECVCDCGHVTRAEPFRGTGDDAGVGGFRLVGAGLADSLNPAAQGFGLEVLALWHDLREAVQQACEGSSGVSLRPAWEGRMRAFRRRCEAMRGHPHAKAHELAVEFLNDWEAVFAVLSDPCWPLTNNEAERALRHGVILRQISHGTRTPQGSRHFALLASVIDTCRRRGHSPWAYLQTAITRRRQGLALLPLPVQGGDCLHPSQPV